MRIKRIQAGEVFLAFVLSFPFFLNVGTSGIRLGEAHWGSYGTPGVDFPLSPFFVPLIFLIILYQRGGFKFNDLTDSLVLLYGIINILAFNWGLILMISEGGGSLLLPLLSAFYLMQTVLPLSAYYLPRLMAGKQNDALGKLYRIVGYMMFFIAVSLLLLLIQSIADQGLARTFSHRLVEYIGPFQISKIKRYYPAIVGSIGSLYLSRALFSKRSMRKRFIDLLVAIFFVALIPFIWSRIAILTMAIAWVMNFIFAFYHYSRRSILVTYFLSMFVILLVVAGVFLFLNYDFFVFERLIMMFDSDSAVRVGDLNRVGAYRDAFIEGFSSLFGKAYVPRMYYTLSGYEYGFPRVGISENSYLDLAMKAGPLAMLTFIVIYLRTLWISLRTVGRTKKNEILRWVLIGLWVVLFSIAIGSNNTQQNFTEPYTAFFYWFIFGTMTSFNQMVNRNDERKV